MIIRTTEVKELEEEYQADGNRLVVYYGDENSQKEQLLRYFMQGKKVFYYRARPASEKQQRAMMGSEILEQYHAVLSKYTYEEYFNRIKSGDASKLVVLIDEFQHIAKKDPTFLEAIFKLKTKQLYPGPVLIVLASSAFKWIDEEGEELFGKKLKKVDRLIRLEDMNFLEVVHAFSDYSVSECVQVYGIIGGVPAYVNRWDAKKDLKYNICKQVLSQSGNFFHEAERVVGRELRELSVYDTILCSLAAGNRKLNDIFHDTGFSRAKISVYLKNLIAYDIVEKISVFETGGWENAQKGLYQIKHTFIHFWYKFIYPHMSRLYELSPEVFYEYYIKEELDEYLNRYFIKVCREYLSLLNLHDQLSIKTVKSGIWIGKKGNIDIVAQDSMRRNIVAICNWSEPELTEQMWENLVFAMEQAKIKAEQYYLFSAHSFDEAIYKKAEENPLIKLIDMKEL
ncbi:MAG: ATP-binding protein [Lachnospiraceae bacterium]|nr:ATP-binding protein [Lachnospiraceae bacterium]